MDAMIQRLEAEVNNIESEERTRMELKVRSIFCALCHLRTSVIVFCAGT